MKSVPFTSIAWKFGSGARPGLLMLALATASVLPGCISVRGMMALHHRDPMAGAPRLKNAKNPDVEEVVAFLNKNTDRVQSWRASGVRIYYDRFPLQGTIAVEKGRHLRLDVTSIRGKEVDLGSNHERFWVWFRDMEPSFVTCRHENMETARQQVGIPFEPDWLMQAFGVEPLPTAGVTLEVDPANENHVRLVEQLVSAHGVPLRRVVLVDLRRGIVVEHSLYNYNSVPVAVAKLSDHRLDKASGAVMPHHMSIELPQSKVSMKMSLGDIRINPTSIPAGIWEMPSIRDCQVVHLDSGIPPGGIITVVRPEMSNSSDDPIRRGPIETVQTHDEHNFLREEDPFAIDDTDDSASNDPPGRVQLSTIVDDEPVEEDEDDWAK